MEERDFFETPSVPSSSPRRQLFLAIACFAAAILLWFAQIRLEDRQLASRIAPGILRFHVIANSGSEKDQQLKLTVKSFLLEKIYEDTSWQNSDSNRDSSSGKEALVAYLRENKEYLERETEQFIREMGRSYPVSLDIVQCEFPEKYYGDLRLPAGTYETAQVRIGKGRGRNWWCILYPKVCITKDALATVPESSQQELETLLAEEDFHALEAERPVIHIGFRFLELLKKEKTSYSKTSYSASSPKPFTPQ